MNAVRRAVVVAVLLLSSSTLLALSTNTIPAPPAAFTHRANVVSGDWNNAATWSPASVPGVDSVVLIELGKTVNVTRDQTGSRPRWVQVEGKLTIGSTTVNSALYVETLYVTGSGMLSMGSATARIPANLKAEVVFISNRQPINTGWDVDEMSRGLIAVGDVQLFGASKLHMVTTASAIRRGALTIQLPAGTNWRAGDDIVLTGTHFKRGTASQDERRKIMSINASNVATLDRALDHDHLRVNTTDTYGTTVSGLLHLANLTRNVVFRSEFATQTFERGHVFLRHKNTRLDHAAFINLGRTDKRQKLNDWSVKTNTLGQKYLERTPQGSITNRRGRYSVHIHETPIDPFLDSTPPTKVYNCVVDNAIGWGFTNHSSYVDFQNNVAYDFAGAGFVTEDGDELGNFYNDVAIRGRGDGVYRKDRLNFNNLDRPQPISDFAFNGEGFWFSGPAIRVRNVVANGSNGTGVIWHTTGAVDPTTASSSRLLGTYSFFPKAWITKVYGPSASTLQPRLWNNGAEQVVIADLPILECTGVDTYGNLSGIRLRFNNHNSIDWYDEYLYDQQILLAPNTTNNRQLPTRLLQSISNVRSWNNEQGLGIRYAASTRWSNVTITNRLDFTDQIDPLNPMHGAEFNLQVQDNDFENLTIDGYELAGWRSVVTRAMQVDFTPNTLPNYKNYANFDTWNDVASATPVPTGVTNLTSSSATVNWSGAAAQFLVRFRAPNDMRWRYAMSTTNSAALTALASNTTYTYQIIAGRTPELSDWSSPLTFTTF